MVSGRKLHRIISESVRAAINEVSSNLAKPTVYLMFGIPGSGKSTWIKKNLPNDIPIVSRDIIRAELGLTSSADEKAVCSREDEELVTKREYALIRRLAKSGKDFVIDDTNTGRYRKNMIELLRSYGLYIKIIRLNTDLDTCIKRRTGQIPSDVLRKNTYEYTGARRR